MLTPEEKFISLRRLADYHTLLNQYKQDTLVAGVNMDTTPTASSDKPITSNAVYQVMNDINTIIGNNVNCAVPITSINVVNASTGYLNTDVTASYDIEGDGSLTVTGTSTNDVIVYFQFPTPSDVDVFFGHGSQTGSSSTFYSYLGYMASEQSTLPTAYTTTCDSGIVNQTINSAYDTQCFCIMIKANTTMSGVVFSPVVAPQVYYNTTNDASPKPAFDNHTLTEYMYELEKNAFSGSYNDLTDKPISDSLATQMRYLNEHYGSIKKVAFTGDYNDLENAPSTPQGVIYGCKVDKNNSDPATRVTYTDMAVGFTPVRLNDIDGKVNLGSWGGLFFVKNNYPAMVTSGGAIDYRLSKTNHAFKEDGVTASDVGNVNYDGNAMSVFDCKIWIKAWEDNDYEYYQIADYQVDEDFHCYPYYRPDGTIANKLYYPMYKGSYYNGKLRSLSGAKGKPATNTLSIQNNVQRAGGAVGTTGELYAAQQNGPRWSICDFAHRVWLNIMLLMISCHDDTQTAFGRGNENGYNSAASDVPSGNQYGWHDTGYLDQAGQFAGFTVSNKPVKVFYIEDWWGKRWDRCLGCWSVNGSLQIKWTPPYSASTAEGEITGITLPASGWQVANSATWGRIPTATGNTGSASKYTCDYFYYATGTNLSIWGGSSADGTHCGAWYVYLHGAASHARWNFGASPYLIDPVD